jgi:hypothetical protein
MPWFCRRFFLGVFFFFEIWFFVWGSKGTEAVFKQGFFSPIFLIYKFDNFFSQTLAKLVEFIH